LENLKGRDCLEDLGADGRIIIDVREMCYEDDVDGTVSGLCSMTGFDITGVKTFWYCYHSASWMLMINKNTVKLLSSGKITKSSCLLI
jgi:hypothetical protein